MMVDPFPKGVITSIRKGQYHDAKTTRLVPRGNIAMIEETSLLRGVGVNFAQEGESVTDGSQFD